MAQKRDGHCPMKPERANSRYRPSWFVLLAAAAFLFSLVRVAAGVSWSAILFTLLGLVVVIALDVAAKRH